MFKNYFSFLFILLFLILPLQVLATAPSYLNENGNTITGLNDSNESVDINLSSEGTLEVNGSTIDIGLGSHPSFVDIDDDGDYDMFVGETGGKVKYFENNGSQSVHDFLASTNLTANGSNIDVGSYAKPSFVDLDDDGDYDLVVGEYNGVLNYYENNGTKESYSFTAGTKLQVNGSNIDVGLISSPRFVDIDDDGDYDLVVGEKGGQLYYYENNGSKSVASFTEGVYLTANGSNIDVGDGSTAYFVDIDDDGDYDLVVGEYAGTLNYFENSGTSTSYVFESSTTLQADNSNIDMDYYSTPTFVDLENDDKQDLVLGGYDGKLYYYKNHSDTDYSLKYSIEEGSTTVATIESYDEEGDSVTYGVDSSYEDGALFTFNGTTLAFIIAPDYENPSDVDGNNTYDVNITISDGNESSWTVVEVSVSDVNDDPTDISLSNSSVTENNSSDTTVGTLTATDEDADDSHTFTFCGGSDDSNFTISGDTLLANAVFDYETKSSYSICVRATDEANATYDETMTISITDVNEEPTISSTATTSVDEDSDYSYTLDASDIEGDGLTWSVTDGTSLPDWLTLDGKNAWEQVGSAEFSAGSADYADIALDSNNTPYVVYKDGDNSDKASVMKYDGSSWVQVGTAGFSAGSVDSTSIVFDSNDTLYVTYMFSPTVLFLGLSLKYSGLA